MIQQNLEAEFVVLGTAIMDNSFMETLYEELHEEHFTTERTRATFKACLELFLSGTSFDLYLLSNKVSFEDRGGEYFSDLLTKGTSPIIGSQYVKILQDQKKKNECYLLGEKLALWSKNNNPFQSDADKTIEESIYYLESLLDTHTTDKSHKTSYEAGLDYLEDIQAYLRSDKKIRGVDTGYSGINDMFSGFENSNLYILAGRPAMGKSALALQIAERCATQGNPVLFFSLEMPTQQLIARLANAQCEITKWEVDNKRLSQRKLERLVEYVEGLKKIPLHFNERAGITIDQIRLTAKKMKRKHGLKMVVIDYMQIINHNVDNLVARNTEISKKLKILARELEIPVLALAQLSRAVESREDKRPQLSDLRESGAIEQDADAVMMMYRHEYYLQNKKGKELELQDCRGQAEVIVTKNRHGASGVIPLHFEGKYGLFNDI